MVFLFIGILLFLFLIGMPVAFGMGIGAVILMIISQGSLDINFGIVAQRLLYGANSFILLSIPLFLLAGNLMNTGGITQRIFKFANVMVGHLRGGLGHVNIVASIIFAGMTGTAVSDAAGLGTVEIKAMTDAGYDKEFSCAITGASSTIGPIIPPSVPLVIYGILASVSIGRLLVAGIIPGLLIGGALMIMVSVYAVKRNYPQEKRASYKEFFIAFKEALLPCMTPVIIVGGIVSGIFTPTEAAGVACLYAFILGFVIYREISWLDLWKIIQKTARDTAIITFIISCASLYGWVLIRSRIPIILMEQITSLSTNPLIILLMLNCALLVVGCFMETIAALNILVPVLTPLILTVGIDPLHFGLIMVFNLMIGLITPPFGMVLFVLNKVSGVPVEKIVKATLPFLIPLLAVLLSMTFFPGLVTYLPNFMFK
ncbi:Sialic acid TRAP transporter large permease protein SiaM [subsurface metagenome]|jgi:tripartite ATP-independent transporter DctM subunit